MKKRAVLILILMLFILIILTNLFLLNLFSIKTATPTSQASIQFSIAKSKAIKIIRESFDGDTTDFILGGNLALENIEDMTLEKIDFGKIVFTEPINLTQDAVSTTEDILYSREVNLKDNVIISKNLIEINTINLPSLEKPATLYFYDLDFNNPRILRNNEVCPSSICQIVSYSNGILKFSVTGFTSYSSEETPVEEVKPTGGTSCTYDWKCANWQPEVCPEKGKQNRICANQGTCAGIVGKPDETRTCTPGKISEELLFDVEVNVITKEVSPGDEVLSEIKLIKISGEKVDVEVDYSIKDQFNNTISTKHEIVAVETKISFIGRLTIPDEVKIGTYTFHARAIYKEQSWESYESFEIIKKLIEISNQTILVILISMIILFITILYYEYKIMRKLNKLFKKVTEEDLIRMGYIKKEKKS